MSQIEREGRVSFGDASINVWEEPGGPVQVEWEREFKRHVFKRIVQQLNRLGWRCEVPKDYIEKYGLSFAQSRRYCRKGNLEGFLDITGRHIKFEMWQSVANLTREDGNGKYEFDKEKRMPYLLWLEMERTRRRIRDYLCNVFAGYEFNDRLRDGRYSGRGPWGLTAVEWVEKDIRSSGHFNEELGHAPISMKCNAQSADGGVITHGARVYAVGHDDRIVVGTAYYDLNSSWWVVTGKYGAICVQAGDIYLESPGNLRTKRNERKRRTRLEQELSKAVKAMDFHRAQVIKEILFPTAEPLFMVYHKGHDCYHRPNFSGYTKDSVEAGRFTWRELGRFMPKGGVMEDELSKVIPVNQEARAA